VHLHRTAGRQPVAHSSTCSSHAHDSNSTPLPSPHTSTTEKKKKREGVKETCYYLRHGFSWKTEYEHRKEVRAEMRKTRNLHNQKKKKTSKKDMSDKVEVYVQCMCQDTYTHATETKLQFGHTSGIRRYKERGKNGKSIKVCRSVYLIASTEEARLSSKQGKSDNNSTVLHHSKFDMVSYWHSTIKKALGAKSCCNWCCTKRT
jgi:hypothetical protein